MLQALHANILKKELTQSALAFICNFMFMILMSNVHVPFLFCVNLLLCIHSQLRPLLFLSSQVFVIWVCWCPIGLWVFMSINQFFIALAPCLVSFFSFCFLAVLPPSWPHSWFNKLLCFLAQCAHLLVGPNSIKIHDKALSCWHFRQFIPKYKKYCPTCCRSLNIG